jgi:hypothetical protein
MPMVEMQALECQNHRRTKVASKTIQNQRMKVQLLMEIQTVSSVPDRTQEFASMSRKESTLGLRKGTTVDQTYFFELGQYLWKGTIADVYCLLKSISKQ